MATDETEHKDQQPTETPAPIPGYDEMTVPEVIVQLEAADPETVAAIKEYEAATQNRKGIRDWEPTPVEPAGSEPRFTRERLLGPQGEEIVGKPAFVIAGALHDDDTPEFTRAQIKKKVDAFLERPVSQEG